MPLTTNARQNIRGDAPSDFRIENPADVLTARGAAVHILNILWIAVVPHHFAAAQQLFGPLFA